MQFSWTVYCTIVCSKVYNTTRSSRAAVQWWRGRREHQQLHGTGSVRAQYLRMVTRANSFALYSHPLRFALYGFVFIIKISDLCSFRTASQIQAHTASLTDPFHILRTQPSYYFCFAKYNLLEKARLVQVCDCCRRRFLSRSLQQRS